MGRRPGLGDGDIGGIAGHENVGRAFPVQGFLVGRHSAVGIQIGGFDDLGPAMERDGHQHVVGRGRALPRINGLRGAAVRVYGKPQGSGVTNLSLMTTAPGQRRLFRARLRFHHG